MMLVYFNFLRSANISKETTFYKLYISLIEHVSVFLNLISASVMSKKARAILIMWSFYRCVVSTH